MEGSSTWDWPTGIHPLRPAALELFVSKEDFKFNAAHFIIHEVGLELTNIHCSRTRPRTRALTVRQYPRSDRLLVPIAEAPGTAPRS